MPHVVASASDYPEAIASALAAIYAVLERRPGAGIAGHAIVELGLCSAAAADACARRKRVITGPAFQEICVPWVNGYDVSREGGVALCQVELRQKLRLAGGDAEIPESILKMAEEERRRVVAQGEARNKTMSPEEEQALKLRRTRRDLKLKLREIASIKSRRKDVKRAYESLEDQRREVAKMEETLVKIDTDPNSLWLDEVRNAVRKAESRLQSAQEALLALEQKTALEAGKNIDKLRQVIGAMPENADAPEVTLEDLVSVVQDALRKASVATQGELRRV